MLTIGVIGAGDWGKNIVRTFHSLKSVKLKYIVDTNQDILSNYENYKDVEKLTDYHTVLEDPDLNALAIATSLVAGRPSSTFQAVW